ncbi:MAG: OFA family MFS transporter, partial [Anaerolineae bacterium]|nr:OFA family MFS transporter [Anaerolineae bacterium]
TDAQKILPYSIACVVFSLMTMVGARLLGKFGPRAVVSAGGVFAGLGVIISSLTTDPWIYALAFGLLLGTGIGFVYSTASPTALKWFPASKTGLISGIVVAGFGMGSAWVAPLARTMIAAIGLQSTMLYLGVGMLVVVVFFAQFLSFPPAGFVPAGTASTASVKAALKDDFTPGETAKTWQFYLLWLAFAFGSGAGLMVIGNLASIVKDQIGMAAMSALAVTALAIGNGGGRVLYGMLSDRIGRKAVLLIAFLLQAGLIFFLSTVDSNTSFMTIPLLMVLVALIGANYGANLAVFPAITKDYFGLKNFAMNYGILYTAWGLGGFMLSQLAGSIKDATGSFKLAYLLAVGLLLIAAVLMAIVRAPQRNEETSPATAQLQPEQS